MRSERQWQKTSEAESLLPVIFLVGNQISSSPPSKRKQANHLFFASSSSVHNGDCHLMLKPLGTCLTVIPGSASFGFISTSHSTVKKMRCLPDLDTRKPVRSTVDNLMAPNCQSQLCNKDARFQPRGQCAANEHEGTNDKQKGVTKNATNVERRVDSPDTRYLVDCRLERQTRE